MKKVTIILPTYNGKDYIKDSILSILEQSYDNWELIIVNDCSTDATKEIIENFAKQEKRIKIINNATNLKLPASLNVGFKHASGEYYTWTSDDNIFKKDAIKFMVNYLEEYCDTDMISCNFDVIDENGIFISEFEEKNKRTALELAFKNNIGACFMYRKTIAEIIGKYDENTFCVEDYDYWCRIALIGKIDYSSKNFYKYRLNPNSLSATKSETVRRIAKNIKKKYSLNIIKKYEKNKNKQIGILLKLSRKEKDYFYIKNAFKINSFLFFINLFKFIFNNIFSLKKRKKHINVTLLGIHLNIKS